VSHFSSSPLLTLPASAFLEKIGLPSFKREVYNNISAYGLYFLKWDF
jgi:hypothetical protein